MPFPIWVNSLSRLCSRCLVGSELRATAKRRSSSCCIRAGSSRRRITSSQTDLIQKFLSDEAAVVAHRAAELPPTIGADAFVVVKLTRACLRGRSREGIAALRTADQPLDYAGRNGTPTRSYLVVLEQLLGTGEARFRHQSRHGDPDPLFARAFVSCCAAGHRSASSALGATRVSFFHLDLN